MLCACRHHSTRHSRLCTQSTTRACQRVVHIPGIHRWLYCPWQHRWANSAGSRSSTPKNSRSESRGRDCELNWSTQYLRSPQLRNRLCESGNKPESSFVAVLKLKQTFWWNREVELRQRISCTPKSADLQHSFFPESPTSSNLFNHCRTKDPDVAGSWSDAVVILLVIGVEILFGLKMSGAGDDEERLSFIGDTGITDQHQLTFAFGIVIEDSILKVWSNDIRAAIHFSEVVTSRNGKLRLILQ